MTYIINDKKIDINHRNDERFIVNLCPTGMVLTQAKSPYLPITPKEIGKDVARCFDAGASMVHLHAREDDETPTWRKERFEEIIYEIDVHAPDIIICVTTSGRNWSDLSLRTQALSVHSAIKPELASLTLGSMNFAKQSSINSPESIEKIAELIYAKRMIPELEIFDLGMANYAKILARKGLLKPPFYFNIILGSQGTADFNATNMAAIINSLPDESTWALAGIGRYQLQANIAALALGGHVRVGLEDNPYYDWKKRGPTSNVQLVERIVRIGKELGLQPASPTIARSIIGLPVRTALVPSS